MPNLAIDPGERWTVWCRTDTEPDGTPGGFVLATRRIFTDKDSAQRYCNTIAKGREPFIQEE